MGESTILPAKADKHITERGLQMDKQKLLAFMTKHRRILWVGFRLFDMLPFNNAFPLRKGLRIETGLSYLRGCKIINHGKNNTLVVGDFSRLQGCTITISGSNNVIQIGDRCMCNQACFCIEDDNNTIRLDDRTLLCGKIELAAIEGTSIEIGKECLFSSNIDIRTGDSHSLLQKGTGTRINPSKSIRIGDHVWVGRSVTILKGTTVPENCMVGAASLLCKAYVKPNCVLAGVPAREVKQDIEWIGERI